MQSPADATVESLHAQQGCLLVAFACCFISSSHINVSALLISCSLWHGGKITANLLFTRSMLSQMMRCDRALQLEAMQIVYRRLSTFLMDVIRKVNTASADVCGGYGAWSMRLRDLLHWAPPASTVSPANVLSGCAIVLKSSSCSLNAEWSAGLPDGCEGPCIVQPLSVCLLTALNFDASLCTQAAMLLVMPQ